MVHKYTEKPKAHSTPAPGRVKGHEGAPPLRGRGDKGPAPVSFQGVPRRPALLPPATSRHRGGAFGPRLPARPQLTCCPTAASSRGRRPAAPPPGCQAPALRAAEPVALATGAAHLPRLALRRLRGDQEGSRAFPQPPSGRKRESRSASGFQARKDPVGLGVLELGPQERKKEGTAKGKGQQSRGRS